MSNIPEIFNLPVETSIASGDLIPIFDVSAGQIRKITQANLMAGVGVTDHGALTGLSDNDHPQYLLVADIDDTPVNGEVAQPISSNWAFDHVAAADPHTGYRLESADHNHQSTGAEGGQLDHGLALTGLSDDDHTIYLLADGTRGLSAAWDAGSWQIRAETFQSDVATGTAPFTVASTTVVTNLNADLLDGQSGAYYLDSANFTGTNWTDLTDAGATTLHKHDHGGMDGLADDDHALYLLASDATNRATFASNWTDLTDGGTTTLHTHTSGTASALTVANEATDTTCFPLFVTAATGDLAPKSNTGLTFNSNTQQVGIVSLTASGQLTSTLATGTAPLVIASTTKVANLNADLLDDQSGAYYLDSANFTGTNWTDLTDAGATTLHKHDHGGMDGLADDDHTQYLLAAGTRALSADWDAGSFEIRAQTFESDVATGTAPLVVASTTKVTNLNADLLDDQSGAYYLDSANFTGTNWTDLTDGGSTTLHTHSIYGLKAGETWTGAHDFGGADSLEIPNSAAPTVNAAGEIALDTTITDYTGMIKYYDGVEELTVLALPTANLSTSDGYVVAYNATNKELEMVAGSTPPTPKVDEYTGGSASFWTNPSADGYTMCLVECWGGGGSGGKGRAGSAGGGGGGGGYSRKIFRLADLDATESYAAGGGGPAQTVADSNGTAGDNTTFGNDDDVIAYGGGAGSGTVTTGGNGGGGGGSDLRVGGNASGATGGSSSYSVSGVAHAIGAGGAGSSTGMNGWPGLESQGAGGGGSSSSATAANGAGGNAVWGGAGGGAGAEDSSPGPGAGGTSKYGGAGGAGAFDANNATAGSIRGGGGGGSETGNSGAGGAGFIRITCW